MKHPEYDSPFELVVNDVATQIAKRVDESCWQAVQNVGINVDKDKLLAALKQDAERYRRAFANGYDTGYEIRDEEIIRCKNCQFISSPPGSVMFCEHIHKFVDADWFCADGERRDDDG